MSDRGALTPRAIGTGLFAGVLLALGNLTVGLATGIWDSGQITASLVAFALASAIPRAGATRFTPLENDAAQMIACAFAAMPAAMGLLGAIPALQTMGLDVRTNALLVLAFGTTIALLGAGLAFLLARRLLDEEKLPFPTGVATAELISALHGDGGEARTRTRALLFAGFAALALVWFRDGHPALIPGALFLPISLGGLAAAALGLGVGASPLLWGVGIVVGARTAISLALGGLIAWGIWGPQLVAHGVVARVEDLGTFLVWPGVALLVGATAVDLLGHSTALFRSLGDLRGAARGELSRFSAPAISLALLAMITAHLAMGVSYPAALLALLLFAPLVAMVARAAGQTDFAPMSQSGQLTQAAAGPLSAGAPLADVGAGAIVSGGSSETAVILWSLRAGRILGAKTQTQLRAAAIGIAFGALFSLPAYLLLVKASPIGSARNPAPSAVQWRAIAEVVTRGTSAFPPGATRAAILCALVGALLALASRSRRLAVFLPSPVALGIGFLIPATASFAMLFGGLGALLLGRLRPARSAQLLPSIAAGFIAGESLLSFALLALGALGLFHN